MNTALVWPMSAMRVRFLSKDPGSHDTASDRSGDLAAMH